MVCFFIPSFSDNLLVNKLLLFLNLKLKIYTKYIIQHRIINT